MTRLKFLAFAVLALGLWAAHLFLLSPAVGAALGDQASGLAVGAPAAVALKLESSRSELQAVLLKLISTPAITNPGPKTAKPEAPTADRFTQVRGAVMEALPEALKEKVVVGVVNDVGALVAHGTADAAAPPEGFDAKLAGASGGKGEVMDAFGARHLIYSVPVFAVDHNEVKAVATAFVGLPLVNEPQALVDSVAKELRLSGLALSVDGKVVASSGARKALVDEVLKTAKPGQSVSAEKGSVAALGPVKFPMLTAGDLMGGGATLEYGVRRDIPGTPFEVIAIASARPGMEALGGYQKTALFIFFGLLAAAIAFTLLMGGGEAPEEEAYVGPRRAPVPAPVSMPASTKAEAPAPLPIADAPPAPEATADDFNFDGQHANPRTMEVPSMKSKTQDAPAYSAPPVEEESSDPFASLGPTPEPVSAPPPPPPPPASKPPPPSMGLGDEDNYGMRTTSYPAHGSKSAAAMASASTQAHAAMDPFAEAGGFMSPDEQMQGDNPDATRVAVIPQELLNASARGNTKENPVAMPKLTSAAAPMPRVAAAITTPGASGEEAHFHEVFRDFVATREKCGEAADGLTFEKFATKLRKNKEQLVTKYNCKTVRFQVYVKEGKAALKATPVKE